MKNIIKILTLSIFVSAFLSSCGFNPPVKENSFNIAIVNSDYQDFSTILKSGLNLNSPKKLTLNILKIKETKTNASYDNSKVSNYSLGVIVEFAVYDNEKLIFEDKISDNRFLHNVNNISNSPQESLAYAEIKQDLARKIINKISKL